MTQTKAMPGSDWREGFLFVGNELILDFLNTRPVINGKSVELLPDVGALLRWFHAAELLSWSQVENIRRNRGAAVPAQRTLVAMCAWRERLREEVLRLEHGGKVHRATLQELNRQMEKHPMLIRVKQNSMGLSTELWFAARQAEDLFAPLAHSAAKLFSRLDRKRVRKCDQCVLHFHDTSKRGTRRWCSMQLCGNRLKVAAYAARRRATRFAARP